MKKKVYYLWVNIFSTCALCDFVHLLLLDLFFILVTQCPNVQCQQMSPGVKAHRDKMCIPVVCEFRTKFRKRKLKEMGRVNVVTRRKLKLKVMLRKQEVDVLNGINRFMAKTSGELLCEQQRTPRFILNMYFVHLRTDICYLERKLIRRFSCISLNVCTCKIF